MARPRRPPRDCLPGAGIACQAPLARYIHPPRPLLFPETGARSGPTHCSRSPPPFSIRCLFFQPLGAFLVDHHALSSSSSVLRRPRSPPRLSLSLSLLFIGSRPLHEYASAYPFLFSFMYASTSRYEFSGSLSLDLNGEQAL